MDTSILPPAPSVDDLMRMIAETHRSIIDMREQAREQAIERAQEFERWNKEAEQRKKELDQRFEETRRMLRESGEAYDRRAQKLQDQLAATDKQLGKLGNRLGEFVEYMVRPAAVRLFQERKLDVHQVIPNLCAYDDNRQLRSQVDLLVINNATAIVVECKSACSINDVKEHLERLAEFKDCFPQCQSFNLLGAVAAMVMPDEVGRFAYRQGLFVMVQNGEIMEIRNDGEFQPKTW